MGQVNSTQATSSQPISDPGSADTLPSASSIPSVEDMRNLTHRILSSTNDALKNLRENIPAIELPSALSPSSTSSASAGFTESSDPVVSEGLGVLTGSSPVVVMTNDQLLVYRSYADGDSVSDLIKIHYQLSVDWVRKNAVTVAVGTVALGLAIAATTVAVRSSKAHGQKMRRLRVLKGREGAKREVVVVTHISTLEGVSLALSLEQQGFIVFVGVPDQAKVDEVESWGRVDIRPVIVDVTKSTSIEELVRAVSGFLDQNNSGLLGGGPASSSSSVIYQEELSSSIANIRLVSPEHTLKSVSEAEAKRRHHGKTDSPLYRLAAVIINPHAAVVGSVEKVDLEEWGRAIDINIKGSFVAAQKFMPLLRRTLALAKPRRSPRLILLSSAITGSIGFPYQSSICASHHAIESIADSLRREVKPQGIDVVCLRPGITDTSFRKDFGDMDAKKGAGHVGLLNTMDPTKILKSTFKQASTTAALCEATYDAITLPKPASSIRIGRGSLSYAFVGWAVPRQVVDWSIKGSRVKVHSSASVKVSTTTTTTSKSSSVREE